MNQQWWAASFVCLSLGLAIGWPWLKAQRLKNYPWPHLAEQWPGSVARFFYFVGLPYLAVIFGLVPVRLLGLKGLDSFVLIDLAGSSSTLRTLAEIQSATTLMLLEWLVDSQATIIAGLAALIVLGGVRFSLARYGIRPAAERPLSAVDTIYDSLHWAFYRAVFWLITGDLYLGMILGVGLVILEWTLVARLKGDRPTQPQPLLMNIIILILTATVFFYSPNLWLLWPFHWAMVSLVKGFDRPPRLSYV